ncbi:MAG: DUF6152 family protein [Gammaproteobacteria bacterium]|jgi:hypothetical protein
MKFAGRIAALALLSIAVGSSVAHHSFSPVYDGSRTVTLTGIVTEFRFVNPHAGMSLDVTDNTGGVTTWNVEFDGRLNLTNHGWTEDTIRVGERLSVTGNPTHTGSQQMFFMRFEREDGEVVVRGGDTIQSLEDERRRRREQRRRQDPDVL